MSKRKPNWTDREKVVLLEEYEKRKIILKAKFSSSITSGDKNRAWQEIVNIVNAGNSVKRDIKEIQKKWDNICATAKTEVSLHLNLSINSKSSYISNGLVLSLMIRSLLIALLTSSIRYQLT
jgi:hypothetical protein